MYDNSDYKILSPTLIHQKGYRLEIVHSPVVKMVLNRVRVSGMCIIIPNNRERILNLSVILMKDPILSLSLTLLYHTCIHCISKFDPTNLSYI